VSGSIPQGVSVKNLVDFNQTEAILSRYQAVAEQIKELEGQKETLRAIILKTMADSGEQKLVAGEMVATAVEQTRENFNLKTAKEELGYGLLKPFISKSKYYRLTVK
jgi:hypothetical protein